LIKYDPDEDKRFKKSYLGIRSKRRTAKQGFLKRQLAEDFPYTKEVSSGGVQGLMQRQDAMVQKLFEHIVSDEDKTVSLDSIDTKRPKIHPD
jgi:hypothetical protein